MIEELVVFVTSLFFVMDYSSNPRGLRDLTNLPSGKSFRAMTTVSSEGFEAPSFFASADSFPNETFVESDHVSPYVTTSASQECYCKLLLTSEEASASLQSSMISSQCDLEVLTGATLNVSSAGCEGTSASDLNLVISGSMAALHAALSFVGERVGSLRDAEFSSVLRRRVITLRVVVPNSVVGVLMGRGGRDIRALAVSSGVRIQISQRMPGALERVVNVTGTLQQAVYAAATVVETIQCDPHTIEHAVSPIKDNQDATMSTPQVSSYSNSIGSSPDTSNDQVAQCLQELILQLQNHPELLANLPALLAQTQN